MPRHTPQNETANWNDRLEQLVDMWQKQASGSKALHYTAHQRYARLHYLIGVPVVVATTAVGTAIFASFGESLDTGLRIVFGIVSVLASILASLQTFLRFSERSEQHRMAAARYSIVAREIQQTLAMDRMDRGGASTVIEQWRAQFAALAEQSPAIPAMPETEVVVQYGSQIGIDVCEGPKTQPPLSQNRLGASTISAQTNQPSA